MTLRFGPLLLAALVTLNFSVAASNKRAGGLSVLKRNAAREFPSVFQAWAPAQIAGEDPLTALSSHDLVFCSAGLMGLAWNDARAGLATGFKSEGLSVARAKRATLLQRNPRQIILCEIRYRDAPRNFLPDDSPWWKRSASGERESGWAEGKFFKLNFAHPEYRRQVARQCRAAVESGVFDGIMLDWWDEGREPADRLALLEEVRAAIGRDALIIVNSNDRPLPLSAPFIDGIFLECYDTRTPARWKKIADTLRWARGALHGGRFACLEFWYHQSRQDLNLMRAVTTLSLTLSDGYCLFSDPNSLPSPDHLHDWYSFWNKSLGRPIAIGVDRPDGAIERRFEHGLAVHNPMGNPPVTVVFATDNRSLASGVVARTHRVASADGDIFVADK
ncbi:MAG: glycoside hydrolase family 18 protein [Opitutaceae bacterium]|nr:glycoside hydrolase family 18 protein [Opitutaceae bacterium]